MHCKRIGYAISAIITALWTLLSPDAVGQTVIIDSSPEARHQVIDGFGAHQSGALINQTWWQNLFFDDLGASIFRVDMTPAYVSPYSDLSYYSPWFMGSQTNSVFNLEDPDNPDGPENNR